MTTPFDNGRQPYTTVIEGGRGFFVIQVQWYDDMGPAGGYDIWNNGDMSYATPQEAADEARSWADAEEIECEWYGPIRPEREYDE